jgi:hypothetical protein
MTELVLIHEYLFQSYFSIQRYYLVQNCMLACMGIYHAKEFSAKLYISVHRYFNFIMQKYLAQNCMLV